MREQCHTPRARGVSKHHNCAETERFNNVNQGEEMRILSVAAAVACAVVLAACGGGGGGSDSASMGAEEAALQGTWIYSSDNHPSGQSCGLTIHGGYGERTTLTFSNGKYTAKLETCAIISGNTGGYVLTREGSASYRVGGVALNGATAATTMTELDMGTYYTAFNVTSGKLRLATETATRDGSSSDKRAYSYPSGLDPVYQKQ